MFPCMLVLARDTNNRTLRGAGPLSLRTKHTAQNRVRSDEDGEMLKLLKLVGITMPNGLASRDPDC